MPGFKPKPQHHREACTALYNTAQSNVTDACGMTVVMHGMPAQNGTFQPPPNNGA